MSATFTATVAAALASRLGALLDGGSATGPAAGLATCMAAALAAVFMVAAVLKFRSPAATTAEFTELGLPAPKLLTRVVPIIELITAAALVVRPLIGAVSAAALLLAFTAVLVATVRSGRTVTCGCFGAVGRKPISVATVARNITFLAMTGLVATTPSPTVPDLASIMLSATLGLAAALILQLISLHNQLGRLWSVELAGESGPSGASA